MSSSCGIDLGTTNSCIALAREAAPEVVRDDVGRDIVPSVVHISEDGRTIVGWAARARIGQSPPPIEEIKRFMGTDHTVAAAGRERTPVEVSAEILKFLKAEGERAGGGPLEHAVVTVPAYFEHKQKQDTEEAARLAGFREVVILQEPVAAALAYCLESDEESMLVLAYDLGGGTFDVTVLERSSENEISVVQFGGDNHLGGSDFDRALVEAICRRLAAVGYAVDWDPRDPKDRAALQVLKYYAEELKKELSRDEKASITVPRALVDKKGETIDLDLTITRAEFEALIRPKVEETIRMTLETVAGSGVPRERLSKVIMVGGSSRIPLVKRSLESAIGREAELVDPDTIVARGAALKAARSFGRRVEGSEIVVHLDFEPSTSATTARIVGRLDRPVRDWTSSLVHGEYEATATLQDTDTFRFDAVPLEPGAENRIGLSLYDAGGEERLSTVVTIAQTTTAAPILVPDALVAKPVSVRTAGGLETMLEAGQRLPTRVLRRFRTQDQTGVIRVPIHEGNVRIAQIDIRNVPGNLPVGSEIEVELQFHADYSVHGRAAVLATATEVSTEFRIPALHVLSRDEIAARTEELGRRMRTVLETPGSSEPPGFTKSSKRIEEELALREPNLVRATELVGEMELATILAETDAAQAGALLPPLPEIQRRLDEAKVVLSRNTEVTDRGRQEFLAAATDLSRRAEDAWSRRDHLAWGGLVSGVAGLEAIAAGRFGLAKMSDEQVRDLVSAVAGLLMYESNRKPQVRSLLGDADLEKLQIRAAVEPRAAGPELLDLLMRLLAARVIVLEGPDSDADRGDGTAAPTRSAASLEMLKGLLQSLGS